MGVIGTFVPYGVRPDELIAAVREEIYAANPGVNEMDIILLMHTDWTGINYETEELPAGSTVADYRIVRIDGEYLFDRDEYDHSAPGVEPADYLMAIDRWARSHISDEVNNYMWIHRHPGDAMEPSPKDEHFATLLATIDFSYTDPDELRAFFIGGMVIADEGARPIHEHGLYPVHRDGVDGRVTRILAERTIKEGEAPDDTETYRYLMNEMADLLDVADGVLVRERAGENVLDELQALEKQVNDLKQQIFSLAGYEHPLQRLLNEMQEIANDVGLNISGTTEVGGLAFSIGEPIDFDSIVKKATGDLQDFGQVDGADLRQFLSGQSNTPPKPGSIFDLPKVTGDDDDAPKTNLN